MPGNTWGAAPGGFEQGQQSDRNALKSLVNDASVFSQSAQGGYTDIRTLFASGPGFF